MRLKLVSRRKRTPVSAIIQEAVQTALDREDTPHLETLYQQLSSLVGMIKEPLPDASSSIDELLYGENGVWKGQNG